MGWFEEQIKERKQKDQEMLEEAFVNIAGAVVGQKVIAALKNESRVTKDAIDEILKFYHVKSRDVPDKITDVNEQLEYLLRPYGIMRRNVKLEPGWHRDAMGAMLGVRKKDGTVVAFVPTGLQGYTYLDLESGKRVRVTAKNETLFQDEAIAFYLPFPLKKMGIGQLLKYMFGVLQTADYVWMVLATLAVTLIGLLIPKIHNVIFGEVIPAGSMSGLLAVAVFLVCSTVSGILFTSVRSLLMARINTKMGVSVQAATMMRVLSLRADFFKDYSAGELSQRTQYMNQLCNMLVQSVIQTGLTAVFSLLYLSQIFVYARELVLPALAVIVVTVLFSVITALVQMGVSQEKMELSARESGMCFSMISGVQKIKLAGAEKRAFARWGNLYAKEAALTYQPPVFLKINSVLSTAISLVGTFIMYDMAIRSSISVADYYAFHSAYAMVSGAFLDLASITLLAAQIKPILHMVSPILEAVPEISKEKQVITRLSGSIELNNVSFRYQESMPLILDNISLKIRPGQYVAIVGKTGCGKSTLMRLLLGFEKPGKGAVYYDGKDMKSMDLKSLRRKIGVVMQNGKLFQGDIFSNISISAPYLTMEEAWEAAEIAGIAEDIRNMPMGMYTMVSEGNGGISGGQRQRLMIARAIAAKPKILMFDEATSALDNLTQKKVSDALEHLKCTRIVIAHRLSTIKQCDRILVLDQGHIVEDGTYEELLEQKGFFSELVARQQVAIR